MTRRPCSLWRPAQLNAVRLSQGLQSPPRLPDDDTEGALRLLLQFGCPLPRGDAKVILQRLAPLRWALKLTATCS